MAEIATPDATMRLTTVIAMALVFMTLSLNQWLGYAAIVLPTCHLDPI